MVLVIVSLRSTIQVSGFGFRVSGFLARNNFDFNPTCAIVTQGLDKVFSQQFE
jgi:hypothetical protein